jgi:RNA polymerase sigma-70 factor (ECF subfamily)
LDATREETERPIQQACSQGDIERAATLALDVYGREVLGFLIARLGEQGGHDVFSDLLEDFWRGLPGFQWRSSLRSWLYTLARHAISRHGRSARRRRDVPFQSSGAFSEAAQRVRSETAAYLRTPVKSRFRELRARLSDDEQTLLMLRIDRNLSWRELAAVMTDYETEQSEDDLDRIAARMRQRFQSAKERLRQMAQAEGLLPAVEDEG